MRNEVQSVIKTALVSGGAEPESDAREKGRRRPLDPALIDGLVNVEIREGNRLHLASYMSLQSDLPSFYFLISSPWGT